MMPMRCALRQINGLMLKRSGLRSAERVSAHAAPLASIAADCLSRDRCIWSRTRQRNTVTNDCRQQSWWKRVLNVALAQFVAIQLVLGAALAVQMVSIAPVEAAILCADGHGPSDDGRPGDVVHHGLCAACAFAAHATPLPGPISVHYQRRGLAHTLQPNSAAVAIVARQHDPRTSQGPPLSA